MKIQTNCFIPIFLLGSCGCLTDIPALQHDWKKPSIFDGLSVDESNAVANYLSKVESMDVKLHDKVTVNSTYILNIERLMPPKTAVLRFLDNSTDARAPDRMAKVILARGDLSSPVMEEYKVWPLPNPNKHQLLQYSKYRYPISFDSRTLYLNGIDLHHFMRVIHDDIVNLNPLINQSTDGYTYGHGCAPKCVGAGSLGAAYNTVRRRAMWMHLRRALDGAYLHPIGIELLVNIESLDPAKWKIVKIWYRGKMFNSSDDIMAAYHNNTLRVRKDRDPMTDDTLYSSLNRRDLPFPDPPRRGPTIHMPDGRRFTVRGHHVSWLQWAFDYNIHTTSGPQVYDIRFGEDRIVYELSMQELLVHYSSDSPGHYHNVYFDSALTLAAVVTSLNEGIDCPTHAVYMDFTLFSYGQARVAKNCVCVFEHTDSVPLRRHYATGMPDNQLIARTVMTIGNYDYFFDVIFRQNGAIEARTSLTGYVLASRYNGPDDRPYGYQIADNVAGTLHSHFVNVKVDMDILGTDNQFATLNLERVSVEDPDDKNTMIHMNKFVSEQRKTEKEAAIKYDFDLPKYLLFHNEDGENKWGNKRSYRLLPVQMAKSLIPEDYAWEKAASWIRYQVAVTKHSDDEMTMTSIYNQMTADRPVVTLQNFIDDNENITNQDLVAWVTLGSHHIPHTEDVPLTTTTGIQLSFFLLPFNYFTEDPSMASRDGTAAGEDRTYAHSSTAPDSTTLPTATKATTQTMTSSHPVFKGNGLCSVIMLYCISLLYAYS